MNSRVKKAVALIDERYATKLSLKALAGELRVSPQYLGDLFKEETGTSFRTYLRRVRMGHAQALLENPVLMMKEIAGMVGYSRCANFDRDFRKEYHQTPSAYRTRLRKASNGVSAVV